MMTRRRVALCHCHGNVLSVCLSVCLLRPVVNYTVSMTSHCRSCCIRMTSHWPWRACSVQPRFINAR